MRSTRYGLLITLLAAAGPLQAEARATPRIEGIVRSADGTPLPHARVVLSGIGRGTVSDRDGRFTLRRVPAGTHRVTASLIGYAPATRDVVLPQTGEPVVLEFALTPTPLMLEGVQVTATPSGRDALTVAQATTQLSGGELDRQLRGSLAGTLEQQPGIAVRYNGPAASMPVLRGLTGDRILVLQDGHRSADLAGSADDHSVTIDPLGAQRVEVVRGPASLLYGTNALGGVVNVITGDIPTVVPARASWTATLQAETATPGGAGHLRGVVPVGDRWVLGMRGAGRSMGDARLGPDPRFERVLPNTAHRNLNAALGLGYLGGRITGGAAIQGYGMEHGVPLPPGEDEEIVLVGRKVTAVGRMEVSLGSRFFPALRLQGSAADYMHEELEDGEVEMAFRFRTQTLDGLVRQGSVGPFSEGAWGASALLRQYVATGEEQLTAPADSRGVGFFAFQEMRLPARASLQLGGRADRFTIVSKDDPAFGPGVARSFTALSGSAGVNAPLAEGISVSVSGARSFRAPTVEELFSDAYHIGTASYEIGDPALRPEIAQGLDAGVRVGRAGVAAEFNLYAKRIDDFIHFEDGGETERDGGGVPVLAYTQSGARFAGAEGRLDLVTARHWVLGVRGDRVRATLSDGTPVSFLPAARLAASVRRDDGRFSAGSALRHAFAQPRVGLVWETPTRAHTLLDLDAGVRLVRGGAIHSVRLRLENVTDRLHFDAASRIKHFAPNAGRNLSVVYRAHF